jgi:DNA primase
LISDFSEINSSFNAEAWLEECYGCEFVKQSSGWLNSCCPFEDHDDSSPSFGINMSEAKFSCFGCRKNGDFIKLVSLLTKMSFPKTIELMASCSGIEIANIGSFEFRNDQFKKALIEVDNQDQKNNKIIMKATSVIRKIMQEDFEKADNLYQQLDKYIEAEDFNGIKGMF